MGEMPSMNDAYFRLREVPHPDVLRRHRIHKRIEFAKHNRDRASKGRWFLNDGLFKKTVENGLVRAEIEYGRIGKRLIEHYRVANQPLRFAA